ncbi:hypothetical protein GCM10028810_05470 [Spirosoma litoris]
MSEKKIKNHGKVVSDQHQLSKNEANPISSSPDLTKFRLLLAQYKAKVFEQNADLLQL